MSEEDMMMLGVGGEGGDMAEDNFQDSTFETGTSNGLTTPSQPLLSSTFNSSPAATYDMVEMSRVGENSSLLENGREGDGNGLDGLDGNGLARQIKLLLGPNISHASNTNELLAAEALMDEAKETDRLLNQFKEIRDLCNNDTKSDFKIFQEDETDGMNAAVRIPTCFVF